MQQMREDQEVFEKLSRVEVAKLGAGKAAVTPLILWEGLHSCWSNKNGSRMGKESKFPVRPAFYPVFLDTLLEVTCCENPQKNWYKNCGKMKQRF